MLSDDTPGGLSGMALDIAGVLTMVDEHLGHILCGSPEVAERGTEYVQGLALAVQSARDRARYLFGALDSIETFGAQPTPGAGERRPVQ